MNEKDIFLKAVENSGLSMTEFLNQLLDLKKEGGRTPFMLQCLRNKVVYKKENDPYQNSYDYYNETEKRLGSNSKLMEHLNKIQTWASNNQVDNALTEKHNVLVETQKDKKISRNTILNEDVKRKTEELDKKVFESYVDATSNIDDKKNYVIKIKKTTMNAIANLAITNAKLPFSEYSKLIKKYMGQHIPILFSLSRNEIIELISDSGKEFNNLDFGAPQKGEFQKFTLRQPIWRQIREINIAYSLNLSMQELGRRLFRYYAYRVYKIFEGK